MRIYHFCCERDMRKIRYQGLSLGAVCLIEGGGYRIRQGWQWLTLNGDPKAQSWATKNIIRYDRTAWRLTIEIPDEETGRLLDRRALEKEIPGSGMLFEGWEGSDDWRVYRGYIPAKWITRIEKKEELA